MNEVKTLIILSRIDAALPFDTHEYTTCNAVRDL